MWFHIQERRAWLRSRTHTVIFDRDPEFARFVESRDGRLMLMLRIWLAEWRCGRPCLRAYLGAVTFCTPGPSRRSLRRLFHLTSSSAQAAGQSPRVLRRRLATILRGYVHTEYARELRRSRLPGTGGRTGETGICPS